MPLRDSNHERDGFFLSFLSGYRFGLHLASSQLVKVEEKVFIYAGLIWLWVIGMGELVVKVPENLKERMSKISWLDWSSVAKKAISERLEDIEELETKRF